MRPTPPFCSGVCQRGSRSPACISPRRTRPFSRAQAERAALPRNQRAPRPYTLYPAGARMERTHQAHKPTLT